ncbi:Spy/CpxP family protein refolding chaperone [Methylobacillus gramineus]|uniref:Spy/CpxP family protein refolding chaperone n=1 Tax=Methylobacillus gramineus TaxID=755169 RepID=UPI001D000269|nr:Spy/CpxP family protein refolding chaperone [Methylobacillus gramineus]MCB5184586.1 Spy/CpxP family protein refolding chaperone [Methylobacillus gramineus]
MKTYRAHLTPLIMMTGLFSLISGMAHAEPSEFPAPGHEPPPFHAGHEPRTGLFDLPPHLSGLDLNEVQQDRIFVLLHAQAPAIRDNFKQQHKLREALNKQASGSDVDQKKIRLLAEQLGKLIADSIVTRVNTEVSIKALLTPDQLAKWEQVQTRTHGPREQRPPMLEKKSGELLPPR